MSEYKKYTIQRPQSVWIECEVEAYNIQEALEVADRLFELGEYSVLDQTLETNYEKYWAQDEKGEVSYE
jgi:hypothetical protein